MYLFLFIEINLTLSLLRQKMADLTLSLTDFGDLGQEGDRKSSASL
jgi:hypothetical protein